MDNKATIILGFLVLIVSSIAVYQNHISSESSTTELNEIEDSVNEMKDTIDESMSKIAQNQVASLEQDASDFNPELTYRFFSIGEDRALPYALTAEITNTHNDHTFVKNIWSLTGEICEDGKNTRLDLGYDEIPERNSIDLVSGQDEYVSVQLPPNFFTKLRPEKTGFLTQIELEMNPFIPSAAPLERIEFPKITYIQFDYKEDLEDWMPTKRPSGEMDCTTPPSRDGHVILNTTNVDDFWIRDWYVFPEE